MSDDSELINGSTYTIGMSGDVLAIEFNNSGPATMEPDEWDAFVAAGNAALGRASTPLEARLLDAIEAADEHAHKGWSLVVEDRVLGKAEGRADGLREALTIVRAAGPTVSRAAVVAVAARLARVASVLESDDRGAQREARRVLRKVIDDMKAMIDASAAPTPKEPGHADD